MENKQLAVRTVQGAATTQKTGSGLMQTIQDGIVNLIKPVTENEGQMMDPREVYRELNDLALEYQDSALQGGDVAGIAGDLQIDNISARDAVFEPFVIERLFQVHAPYKLEVQPRVFAFDANGNSVFGANTANQVDFANVAAASPGLVGWAIRVKANSTLSGDASVTLQKSTTGFSCTVSLEDINSTGVLAVLNHDLDDLKTASLTTGAFAANVQTLNYAESTQNVSNQLFFNYTEQSSWSLTGRNAVVYVYPIIVSRVVNATIYACMFNREMDKLPALLAKMYK